MGNQGTLNNPDEKIKKKIEDPSEPAAYEIINRHPNREVK